MITENQIVDESIVEKTRESYILILIADVNTNTL